MLGFASRRGLPGVRIVFLSVNDEFAGEMQRLTYEQYPQWVVGSVIARRQISLKAGTRALLHSGLFYMARMAQMKIVRKVFGRGRMVLPSRLADRHGVPIMSCTNINDSESIATLQSWRPDLVISTNFSQYIGRKVRGVARIGTWNLHKSYLPHGRGIAPSFYALLEGAPFTGATLHVVDAGFDTGDVLTQERVEIAADDTVYSLNVKTSVAGGAMLMRYLGRGNDQYVAVPQPPGDWRNHTYPSRDEIRSFRKKGMRFF